MSISYHELASTQDKNNPAVKDQNRKYYLVLCVIGFGVFLHSALRAGLMETVVIDGENGVFPGGSFVFKEVVRDYAASLGVMRMIEKDLINAFSSSFDNDLSDNSTKQIMKEGDAEDYLYTIYVDNLDKENKVVPDGDKRFFSGLLTGKNQKYMSDVLLNYMATVEKKDEQDLNREEQLQALPYDSGKLPSVSAAVATFPYTGGFISALLNEYKVFPALVEYAKSNNMKESKIVITSTCNAAKKLCYHYMPMAKANDFLLGRPDSESYAQNLIEPPIIDMKPFMRGLKKVLGLSKKKKQASQESEL